MPQIETDWGIKTAEVCFGQSIQKNLLIVPTKEGKDYLCR